MLKWLIGRRLAAFERAHGYDASYMHEMLEIDPSAVVKFGLATGIGSYRKDAPPEAYYGALVTSSMQADCGPCTQLVVGYALADGVEPETVAAIVRGDELRMTPEAALGARFARAVLGRSAEADGRREEIVSRWGARALLALTFGIMTAQMFPTVKYALGHGKACTRVLVAGETVTPHRLAAGAA